MNSVDARDPLRSPVNIVPLGADCSIRGRFKIMVVVPHDPVYRDDEQKEVTLSLDGIAFGCASSPYDQRQNPDVLRLRLHVWDDAAQDDTSRQLLESLGVIRCQQKRSQCIYDDDEPVADLSKTPIINIGEPVRGKDSQGRSYTDIFIIVKRSLVTQIGGEA